MDLKPFYIEPIVNGDLIELPFGLYFQKHVNFIFRIPIVCTYCTLHRAAPATTVTVHVLIRVVINFLHFVIEHAGHAKDIMQSLNRKDYYGVVIVSGDGLIYEVRCLPY